MLTKEFDQFTFCNQHKWKSVRYSIVVLIRLSKWKCVWFLLLVTTLIHWKCIFFSFSLVYHLREFNFGMHSFSPQTRMKLKYETRDTTTAKWFDYIVAKNHFTLHPMTDFEHKLNSQNCSKNKFYSFPKSFVQISIQARYAHKKLMKISI